MYTQVSKAAWHNVWPRVQTNCWKPVLNPRRLVWKGRAVECAQISLGWRQWDRMILVCFLINSTWQCRLSPFGCVMWSVLWLVYHIYSFLEQFFYFLLSYIEWLIRLSVAYPSSSVHCLVWVSWQFSLKFVKATCWYRKANYTVVTCLNAGEPHCRFSCTLTATAFSRRGCPSGRGGCLSPGSLQKTRS